MIDETPPTQVTVPVQSAWLSKINWTQAVQAAAMVVVWLTGGAINITPDQQLAIIVVIGVVGNIATWIMKTWFTGTVTPASAPK